MFDPIIQELFPQKPSIHHEVKFDTAALMNPCPYLEEDYTFSKYLANTRGTDHDFLGCDFDLTGLTSHYLESGFPSLFARKNLLYIQLLCSFSFRENHFTNRSGLNSYLLTQTFSGKGFLDYKGKEYELNPGDVFLINCMDHHEYHASDEGWGYRLLHFNGQTMPGLYEPFELNHAVTFFMGDNEKFQNAFKELFSVFSAEKPEKEILTNRILIDMLTELLRMLKDFRARDVPVFITEQCAYLQNHFSEKLSLDLLAKEFKISKYHMSHKFKQYTGYSIYNYIIECRINAAKHLLRYSRLSIVEISQKIGFENVNTFYRAFQNKENMSPSEYRKLWLTL